MKNIYILLFFSFCISSLALGQEVRISDGGEEPVETCSGTFTDEGGADGGYSETDYTITICSDNEETPVSVVEFTSFLLIGDDQLVIYDGPDTDSPVLGTFVNDNDPGLFFASPDNESGCLTFEFIADGASANVPSAGWEADISCREPCGTITPELVDISADTIAEGQYSAAVNETINFSADADFENSGEGAVYNWDFGDGTTATGQTVEHFFQEIDEFTVTLTVIGPLGCPSDAFTFTVETEYNSIIVDDETYTVEELVTDVLIDNPCALISNITSSTGTDFSSSNPNGIAYFDGNNSAFPIDEGLILSTGSAIEAEGPETGTMGEGEWPGDNDLFNIAVTIPDTNTDETNDASIIEFDFISFSNQLSFNFLFASEEYGAYQCSYSDVFAFLLTDEEGNTTNLAVVPNTDTPVAVTTIKDGQYSTNPDCLSANAEYFDKYYGDLGLNPNYSPTNYLGNTVSLTASAELNPGETYHIKLAIADARDSEYDSGVFLEAGSFNFGEVNLGPDIDDFDPVSVCEGGSITLNLGNVALIEGTEVMWLQDGEVIPSEEGENLEVTETGTYTAQFSYNDGDCYFEDSVSVEFKPTPVDAGEPENLSQCNSVNEIPIFDLTQNDEAVLNGLNPDRFSINYYENQADAENFENPIADPENYEASLNDENQQTIYVTIRGEVTNEETSETALTECSSTKEFLLQIVPSGQANTPNEITICDRGEEGAYFADLTQNTPVVLGDQSAEEFGVDYYLTQAGAESEEGAIEEPSDFEPDNAEQEIFVRVYNLANSDCGEVASFGLETVTLSIGEVSDLTACDGGTPGTATFDLTTAGDQALDGQDPEDYTVTYYTSQEEADAGTNAIEEPSNFENTEDPQEIFVRVSNSSGGSGCYLTTGFEVEPTSLQEIITDPSPLEICDDDTDTDPFAQRGADLTVKAEEITSGAPSPEELDVIYYASEEALNAGDPIANPSNYQNTSDPQTIYVEVADITAGPECVGVTQFTLDILPLPVAADTEEGALDQIKCDDNNDGIAFESFDLTTSGAQINGGQGYGLSYYTSGAGAEEGGTDAEGYIEFPGTYVNQPALNNSDGSQTVYVRLEDPGTGCYSTTSFELTVRPAPVLNPDGDPFGYILCGMGTTDSAPVDTADIATNLYRYIQEDQINNLIPLLDPATDQSQDLGDYTISYHTTSENAEADMFPVSSGDEFSDGDTLFVRVENRTTGCYNRGEIGEVVLRIEERPAINALNETLEACSDAQGGQTATIDLTQYTGQINPSPEGTFTEFYAGQQAMEEGAVISSPASYVNSENPEQILAKTVSELTGCRSVGTAEITIEVSPRPVVDLSAYDGAVICRDINPVTLTAGGDNGPVVIATGLNHTQFSFEWTRDGEEQMGSGPSFEAEEAGTYQVTVTNMASGCQSVATAEILESNPPEFSVRKLTGPFSDNHTLSVENVLGDGDYEFKVDNGPWRELDSTGTISFDQLSEGQHTVYGRDILGCGTSSVPVTFIGYPDFFTPNQDGYNERWNVIGLQGQPGAKIYIFDRYGKLLKQLSPTGPGWDGTFQGRPLPSNDYWFRVEYLKRNADGTTGPADFKGNFTLKR